MKRKHRFFIYLYLILASVTLFLVVTTIRTVFGGGVFCLPLLEKSPSTCIISAGEFDTAEDIQNYQNEINGQGDVKGIQRVLYSEMKVTPTYKPKPTATPGVTIYPTLTPTQIPTPTPNPLVDCYDLGRMTQEQCLAEVEKIAKLIEFNAMSIGNSIVNSTTDLPDYGKQLEEYSNDQLNKLEQSNKEFEDDLQDIEDRGVTVSGGCTETHINPYETEVKCTGTRKF